MRTVLPLGEMAAIDCDCGYRVTARSPEAAHEHWCEHAVVCRLQAMPRVVQNEGHPVDTARMTQ